MKTIYQELSEERKELQDKGLLPEWYTTAGWQILSSKYTTETEKDFRSVAERISKCAAKWTDEPEYYKQKFFDLIWSGDFSCSSPVVANMGTDKVVMFLVLVNISAIAFISFMRLRKNLPCYPRMDLEHLGIWEPLDPVVVSLHRVVNHLVYCRS